MGHRRTSKRQRRRVGKVSYYFRHGAWDVYYREAGRQVRRRAGDSEEVAGQIAPRSTPSCRPRHRPSSRLPSCGSGFSTITSMWCAPRWPRSGATALRRSTWRTSPSRASRGSRLTNWMEISSSATSACSGLPPTATPTRPADRCGTKASGSFWRRAGRCCFRRPDGAGFLPARR
jgi:hypothetical protein